MFHTYRFLRWDGYQFCSSGFRELWFDNALRKCGVNFRPRQNIFGRIQREASGVVGDHIIKCRENATSALLCLLMNERSSISSSDWFPLFLHSQAFHVFELKDSSSLVSFARNFWEAFTKVSAAPTYFTFRLKNKASLLFQMFSSSTDSSSSSKILTFFLYLGLAQSCLLNSTFHRWSIH